MNHPNQMGREKQHVHQCFNFISSSRIIEENKQKVQMRKREKKSESKINVITIRVNKKEEEKKTITNEHHESNINMSFCVA